MYVCNQLSNPDAQGLQTCLEWTVMQSILPPLAPDLAVQMGLGFWLVCLVAKGFRFLGDYIRTL